MVNYKISIFILICAIILVSGCTDTNLNNVTIENTNNTSASATNLTLNSTIVSKTIPLKMDPGVRYNITITMKNTGTQAWLSNNIILCLANDSNNEAGLFSNNASKYYLKPNTVITTGKNATWSFMLVAPKYPNNYTLMYRLLYNNSTWFGDTVIVNVTDGNYKGPVTFKTNTIPTSMTGGTVYKVNIKVNNTGKTTWYQSDKIALAAVDNEPNDAQWFQCNQRFYLNPGSYIVPGGQGSWNFTMTAPKEGGTFHVKFRMVKGDDDQWFGDMLNMTIKVTPKK